MTKLKLTNNVILLMVEFPPKKITISLLFACSGHSLQQKLEGVVKSSKSFRGCADFFIWFQNSLKIISEWHVIGILLKFPSSNAFFKEMPSLEYFPKGGHQNKQFHRRHINLCFMRAGAGEVLVYSFHSVNLFNWFHFEPDVRVSMKSPHSSGWLLGSFNANTKERYFVTISICPFQVYIEGRNRQNVRKYRAVCLSRVYCAWNCWGGGLFERGGLTRELRTLIEGAGRPTWEVPSLWKLDMRRRHCGCAKYSETQNRQKWNYCSFATC